MEERLQKILARAGIGSRRKCEEYITAGRVSVDGKVVRELGSKADPAASLIRCDGQRIRAESPLYFLVNKPRGLVCTHSAQDGHPRVIDLFQSVEQRLFCVGRLDADSEGLLVVTNDGSLANRLAHPRYQVPRTYQVDVDGVLSPEHTEKLRKGVHLADGVVRFAAVKAHALSRGRSSVSVVLQQGLNREIRRAFAALGLRVRRLRRLAIGRLTDPHLKPGVYRQLTPRELTLLDEDAGLVEPDNKKQSRRPAAQASLPARGPRRNRPPTTPREPQPKNKTRKTTP